MPQIVAAVIIGAGVAAGVKWLSKEMSRAANAARLAAEELKQSRRTATGPRDLGALEFDAATGVYRPTRRRAS
jgi:hypothetical protein